MNSVPSERTARQRVPAAAHVVDVPPSSRPQVPLATTLDRLWNSIADDGLAAAARRVVAALRWQLDPAQAAVRAVMRENEAFDADHGTDTRGEIPLAQLGVDADAARHGNGVYRAVPASHFHAALSLLPHRCSDYVFVDFGSGKGKALLLASLYPYRRIIGVEYVSALHRQALDNVRRVADRVDGVGRIEPILGDVRECELPAAALVCFFFNPFDASIWRSVLARLAQRFQENRLPIHVVYVNIRNVAEIGDVFEEFPVFVTVARHRTIRILSASEPSSHAQPGAGASGNQSGTDIAYRPVPVDDLGAGVRGSPVVASVGPIVASSQVGMAHRCAAGDRA